MSWGAGVYSYNMTGVASVVYFCIKCITMKEISGMCCMIGMKSITSLSMYLYTQFLPTDIPFHLLYSLNISDQIYSMFSLLQIGLFLASWYISNSLNVYLPRSATPSGPGRGRVAGLKVSKGSLPLSTGAIRAA